MDGRYNTRSPAVKRLMREAQELSEPTDQYFAQPLDDNLFEWHFTVRGPADSDFQNGIYHGRIILPVDYPMKPPSIIWLTPNGRFETNKKICLSISGHHPESWQPSWSIRTALLAIIGFMPTHPGGAIGSLDYTPEERKLLAKKSKDWKCTTCGEVTGILLDVSENSEKTSRESKELAAQINLQGEKPKCKEGECPIEQAKLSEIQSSSSVAAAGTLSSTNDTAKAPAPSTNSNTSNTVPEGVRGSASVLPPNPPPPHPTAPPQWCPGLSPFPPMAPMGFPFQYPGMPSPMGPSVLPMQFPYPPSHYSNAAGPLPPPAIWPTLPGMGSIPAPFPPPPPQSLFPPNPPPVCNNNSSVPEDSPSIGSKKTTTIIHSANAPFVRSPMTCPPSAIRPHTSPTASSAATNASFKPDCDDNSPHLPLPTQQDMLEELLSKVKRVGSRSEVQRGHCSSMAAATEDIANLGDLEREKKSGEFEGPGDLCQKEEIPRSLAEGGDTDSEVSKSLKKSANKSISEMLDTNTDDNSECGVPQIEGSDADQRSGLEKSACSSTSDLERGKQKSLSSNKALRQRQSVPSSIPCEISEEATVEADRSEVSSGGQRIEAASGDTTLRNRSRQGTSRLENNWNVAPVPAPLRQNDGDVPRDTSFYIMISLLTASVFILLNRVASIEWY